MFMSTIWLAFVFTYLAFVISLPWTAEKEVRIIGGSDVDIATVPYVLSFKLRGKHACGAAILNEDWGLTAAHCATGFIFDPYKEIQIQSGTDKLNEGGVVHNISEIHWHEEYNPDTSDYDIAVFKVNPSFEYSTTTQPALLPTDYNTTDVKEGVVSGWGLFAETVPILSRTLRYAIVPKISREVCIAEYSELFNITPRQVCYGYQNGGKDTCKGDSGGALTNLNKEILGITSWGNGCGEKEKPGVYTDVILLNDWIKEKIGL